MESHGARTAVLVWPSPALTGTQLTVNFTLLTLTLRTSGRQSERRWSSVETITKYHIATEPNALPC